MNLQASFQQNLAAHSQSFKIPPIDSQLQFFRTGIICFVACKCIATDSLFSPRFEPHVAFSSFECCTEDGTVDKNVKERIDGDGSHSSKSEDAEDEQPSNSSHISIAFERQCRCTVITPEENDERNSY